MKDDKGLTLKQRNFIKVYLETGNATEAAMQSYDCKDRETAMSMGHENLRKLQYQDFLEEAGVTDKLLQEKIMDGLGATRVISAVKGTSANGGSTDFIDVPDFIARHKYLETALKLKKRLNDKEPEQSNSPDTIVFNIQNNYATNGTHKPTTETTNGA